MRFPKHKCSLSLEHNPHKDYYEPADLFINDERNDLNFKSDEAKERAIETDEIWSLQWYPHTPNGFYKIAAPTLEELLELAAEVERAEEAEGSK